MNDTNRARLTRISDESGGIVARRPARSSGVSPHAWHRANRADVVAPFHPHVAVSVGFQPTELGLIAAAIASYSPDGVASHRTAATLWEIPSRPDDPIDVTISNRSRLIRRAGVHLHRPTDLADLDPIERSGIPCTSPIRTLLDLGAVAPTRVVIAVDRMLGSGTISLAEIEEGLVRHSRRGRRGIGALRRALRELDPSHDRPDSVLEVRFTRFLSQHALPRFEAHPVICGIEVDFAHRPTRVAVELDGWAFHSDRASFETDRERDLILAGAGWLVVRLTWDAVIHRPSSAAARLRDVLRARAMLATG